MSVIKNLFTDGVMDKDTDRAFVKGFTHAENLRFHTNDGNDNIGVNPKGSLKVSDLTAGSTDFKCIGAFFNKDKNVIRYKLASTNCQTSIDGEYNVITGLTRTILHDTNNVLKYNKNSYIKGWDEIDGIEIWSEWGNNPRRINTERAFGYGLNGFTEDDIALAVYPPLQKLKITLLDTTTPQLKENNIKELFVCFSYQWRYLDGEYSTLAPFTNPAFFPNNFNYNFADQSNRTMVNKFNQVKLEFNTGSNRVKEIRLIFKESNSDKFWIIDDIDKSLYNYADNTIQSILFDNLKTKRALPKEVARSLFDGVPKTNQSQSLIQGRIILSNYKENYNIENPVGTKYLLNYKLNLISNTNTVTEQQDDGNGGLENVEFASLIPLHSAKSNRDYEVKIAYIFEFGRVTTLLESKNQKNTLFIPSHNCVNQNLIQVELSHKVPIGAVGYKFFIRQNKKHYDYILPTLFYEDGGFRWVKLEGSDIDKVKKNDYLVVKSDTSGILNSLIKVKVLDVKEQQSNFLQTADQISEIKERAGFYFKIKPDGFRMNRDDFEQYEFSTYHNSRHRYNNPLQSIASIVGKANYYGLTVANDTMTTSGTTSLTEGQKARYIVQIDNATSTPNTFKWSDNNGNTFTSNINITAGVPIPLSNGVSITFVNDNGYDVTDIWEFSVRGSVDDLNSRAYGFFRTLGDYFETMTSTGDTLEDEIIESGARIKLTYSEYGRGNTSFVIDNVSSSRYNNIEEWFYKESIETQMNNQGYTSNDFWFVRGYFTKNGNSAILTEDSGGYMTMVLKSQAHGTGTSRVKVSTESDLFQFRLNTLIVLETEPKVQPKEIFHEIGKTYKIINGFHSHITDSNFESNIPNTASDQSQTSTLPLKVTLDWFNCFSYGNGVESYKIKDDYNALSIDNGVKVLASIKEEYKEVTRISDSIWSDVYNDESDFNGLSTFNPTLINFTKLDKEYGGIQITHNDNGNLLVIQEHATGIMPYNKSIIYDVEGGSRLGINTNILDSKSYRPYDANTHGISKNPESFVSYGYRKYFADQLRGDLIRLSTDGITELSIFKLEHYMSNLMKANEGQKIVSGYDPKHKELLVYFPNVIGGVLAFKDGKRGFPNIYTYQPDFMLGANNELYAWKNGVMHRMNATETRNNFFGVQYSSKINFLVNQEFDIEKIFKAVGIESTHAWLVNLKTRLTSKTLLKSCFEKIEDYWYSAIMGNTNSESKSNSIFGLGTLSTVNGVITLNNIPNTISVGDFISYKTTPNIKYKIQNITNNTIVLEDKFRNIHNVFTMYEKNQNIDGQSVRGDILEVEMITSETEKVELRAFRTEVSKSNYS